jgi:hypothetical protein
MKVSKKDPVVKTWWESKTVIAGMLVIVAGIALLMAGRDEVGWILLALGGQQVGLRAVTTKPIIPGGK